MTVKQHILNFLTHKWNSNKRFYTSDIQNLSSRSIRFGRILGSPDTYNRAFRQLRIDEIIKVNKINIPHKREAGWELKEFKND